MKRFSSLLIIFIVSVPLFAQMRYQLKGVVESKNGETIESATVSVKDNAAIWTVTGKNGGFKLNLPKGRYIVVVSFMGYKTVEEPVVISGNKEIGFILEEEKENLEGVMIVGKSNAQLLKESALAVNALNVRPIISSAHNLNSVINKTTGVKVRESGGVGSDFELSINGMSGNSVRYFRDCRLMFSI